MAETSDASKIWRDTADASDQAAIDTVMHPVQVKRSGRYPDARAPAVVTLRAYEVYCHLYGAQVAMVTGHCRGGFGSGEIIAFLYAHSFPKVEWERRFHEALCGMQGI